MADQLPDLVLPCWIDEGDSVSFTHLTDNTIEIMVRDDGRQAGAYLSTLSRKRLRAWLDDIDG